jgi:hypothetical protein
MGCIVTYAHPRSIALFTDSYLDYTLSYHTVGTLGDFSFVLSFTISVHLIILYVWHLQIRSRLRLPLNEMDFAAQMPPMTALIAAWREKDWETVQEWRDEFKLYLAARRRRLLASWSKLWPKNEDTPLDKEPTACKGCSSLPSILYWPNLEVLVIIVFAAAVAESSAAVISGTARATFEKPSTHSFAVCGLIFLALFVVHECARVGYFIQHHTAFWKHEPSGRHGLRDDMLLQMMLAARCLKRPASRFRGEFNVPPAIIVVYDPKDTRMQRALHAPISRFWTRAADDMFLSLKSSWLARVNGARKQFALYQYIRVLVHITFGLLVGTADSHRDTSSAAWHALILVTLALYLVLVWWCSFSGAAVDLIESIFTGPELILSFLSLLLRYFHALGMGERDAMLLGSACLMALSIFVVLAHVVYEIVALIEFRTRPMREEARKKKALTEAEKKRKQLMKLLLKNFAKLTVVGNRVVHPDAVAVRRRHVDKGDSSFPPAGQAGGSRSRVAPISDEGLPPAGQAGGSRSRVAPISDEGLVDSPPPCQRSRSLVAARANQFVSTPGDSRPGSALRGLPSARDLLPAQKASPLMLPPPNPIQLPSLFDPDDQAVLSVSRRSPLRRNVGAL